MELPITVMIVLFVAVVAAGLVITFSSKIIGNVERQFPPPEEAPKEKIVDKGDNKVSAKEIAYLAEDCYQKNSLKVVEMELCYIIHGDIDADSSQINSATNLDPAKVSVDSDITINLNSIAIYYDPVNDQVLIKK